MVSGRTARSVALQVASRTKELGQDAVELIGPPDLVVSRLAIGTGAITPFPHFLDTYQADLAICTDDGFTYWHGGALAIDLGVPVIVVNHLPLAQLAGRAFACYDNRHSDTGIPDDPTTNGAGVTKRLVVCCDGTWDVPDRRGGPSNVTKLALAIAPCDEQGMRQLCLYLKGVGTGVSDRWRGGAFGFGLSKNVLAAYRYLVMNYEPGDEIFLFGFSRGAYTARSTAGLIRNCGILTRDHLDEMGAAYMLYRRRDSASHPAAVESRLFRKSFAHEVRIKVIGVWDTVGSLGIPDVPFIPHWLLHLLNKRWAFHDVQLSSYVDNAFQALAIDERRKQFAPTLWEQQPQSEGQIMEQVWFAGVHTNVGGGYRDTGLADIALLWMMARAQGCGLAVNLQDMQPSTPHPNLQGAIEDSRTGIYRLLGRTIRDIGCGRNANEAVYISAVERVEQAQAPAYQPPNLLNYLERDDAVISSEPL